MIYKSAQHFRVEDHQYKSLALNICTLLCVLKKSHFWRQKPEENKDLACSYGCGTFQWWLKGTDWVSGHEENEGHVFFIHWGLICLKCIEFKQKRLICGTKIKLLKELSRSSSICGELVGGLEQGLFHRDNINIGIAGAHSSAHGSTFDL